MKTKLCGLLDGNAVQAVRAIWYLFSYGIMYSVEDVAFFFTEYLVENQQLI